MDGLTFGVQTIVDGTNDGGWVQSMPSYSGSIPLHKTGLHRLHKSRVRNTGGLDRTFTLQIARLAFGSVVDELNWLTTIEDQFLNTPEATLTITNTNGGVWTKDNVLFQAVELVAHEKGKVIVALTFAINTSEI